MSICFLFSIFFVAHFPFYRELFSICDGIYSFFSALEFAIEIQLSTLINKKTGTESVCRQSDWCLHRIENQNESESLLHTHESTNNHLNLYAARELSFFHQINDGKTKFISVRFQLLKKVDRIE